MMMMHQIEQPSVLAAFGIILLPQRQEVLVHRAQHHQLIALASMFERALAGGLFDARLVTAVQTGAPLRCPCPDMNILDSFDGLDHHSRNPQDRIDWGHRHYFR